eukprot:68163_1
MATESKITDGDFWWIAIVIALTACLIDATGWVIEKGSHTKLQSQLSLKDEETTKLSYLWSCRWWCGFIIHISGTALFSTSLAFTDASLLMPLQSATLAFNTIFAWRFLGEKLNKKQIFGTCLVLAGCFFAVVVGPKSKESSYTASQLHELFKRTDFLVFTAFLLIIAAADYILLKYVYTNDTFLLLSYVFKAGFFASWNILFIKCFIEVVISSSTSTSQFGDNGKSWIPYAMFLLICFSKITSEFWRQEALKKFPGNYVGSIYTLFFIVGVILLASIFFNEFEQVDPAMSIAFTICVGISFIGVLMLTFGDKNKIYNKKHLVGDETIYSPITVSKTSEYDSMELNETRKNSKIEVTKVSSQEGEKFTKGFHDYNDKYS